jgi:hypothetical protein
MIFSLAWHQLCMDVMQVIRHAIRRHFKTRSHWGDEAQIEWKNNASQRRPFGYEYPLNRKSAARLSRMALSCRPEKSHACGNAHSSQGCLWSGVFPQGWKPRLHVSQGGWRGNFYAQFARR